MRRTTRRSSIVAMTRIRPPQFGQASTSTAKRPRTTSHTGIDTGAMSLPAALEAFVQSAAAHRDRHARGLSTTGLAYAIDPAAYGT
jgi:hypothetical protein